MKNTLHSKNLPLVATGIPTPFCNPKTKTTSSLKSFLTLVVMVLGMGVSWGQIAALELGTTTLSGTAGQATFTSKDANLASLPATSLTASQQGQANGSGYIGSKNWGTTTSINTAMYFQFTLTATSGYTIAVTQVSLRMYRSSTGPASIALASDADNYLNPIGGVQTLASASNSTISFPSLTLTGKTSITFRIYSYNASAATGTLRIGDGSAGSADITVTGTVTSASSIVTFSPSSGSITTTTQTAATATNLTSASTLGLSRTGYTFGGWATSAANATAGTVAYANNASYDFSSSITLYAIWTANNNTITFDANTGSGTAMTNQTIATAASANLTSNTYTKAGYTFAGWNTLADGTGTPYVDGASYTMGSANVTLYAKWTINNNTIIWVGTNGIWSEPSNWSPSAPSLSNIIIISSGNPVLDTDFTIGSSGSLTISGSGGLTINPGKTITIAGTADFGGQLVTIKSDGNGTGAIGQVTGTLTGAINVTVERYIPNKRSWRALTAPLKGSISDASIFSQWQNNGNSSDTTTGVELWGPAGDATPSSINTGLAVGPFNSILQYVAGAWSPVIDTNATKLFTTSGNNAFMVFPTGGYGSGLISSTAFPLATTLKATGQLIIGDVPYVGLPSTSHTLIGNPYASPISPLALLTTNTTFDNNLWVWDPNVAGDLNVGVYNLFTKTGATTGTYTNTTGPSYSSNPTPDIQSGQAFFVKAASGTQTLTISESFKTGTVSSNAVFRDAAPAELLRLGLYKQTNNQWSGRDGAIALFFTDADANQTANKMANGSENVAFTKNSELFASEHHLPLVASDVLNVRVWNTTAGANYKLKINTEEFTTTNLDATLEDLFTNSRTPIALDGTAIEYPFAVTTEAASTGNRFRIVFQNAVLGMNNPKANGITILPNPITGDAFQVNLGTLAMGMYTYSICNALGQEVENGSINNVAQNTNYAVKFKNNTAAGMYIMKVTGTDTTVFTAKLIKK